MKNECNVRHCEERQRRTPSLRGASATRQSPASRDPHVRPSAFLRMTILLLAISITSANAEVVPTYSINSSTIQKIDKWIDKDTIVFIELDEVLVMPRSKMFYYNDNPYRLFISNLISLSNENSKYFAPLLSWYQSRKVRLVEDGWLNFIEDLKKRNVVVYGFCTMPIHIENIEQFRLKEIEELGIKFTGQINGKDVLEINKLEGWKSVFFHGIIFTGPFSKSQTMLDFMKVTNISPKKILVFDKIKNDAQIMDKALHRFRMSYYNILYLGAREFTDKPDPNVVVMQQRTLLEQGKWLEDEEAEAILKSGNEGK